ncbi:MAG: aspartate--ammonia ligase [Clostridia bacterium]|nr:aspartate--ammonia ligase [Clostridia bacterium]
MKTGSFVPEGYVSALDVYQTQTAIGELRRIFEAALENALGIRRISAPLFVDSASGLNDDLNGVERPVSFDIPSAGVTAQVVHSLAKWKRMALGKYGFGVGEGLWTDMNAIRRDEIPDNLHSVYVDQWDWEKVIGKSERNFDTLKKTVKAIVGAVCETEKKIVLSFPGLHVKLSPEVFFISSQELEDLYPALSPKERENRIVREKKTVFISGIGGALASGKPHDLRAPDYDDWTLNGDIMFYNEKLDCAFELSSMGIRVDEKALERQLGISGCTERKKLPFHSMLLAGKLPQTIGGGIGQSRLCMLLLEKAHIGEVQASVWDKTTLDVCRGAGVELL